MNNIYVEHLSCRASPGSHIDKCLLEATQLALSEARDIRLEHNGRVFWIRPEQVMSFVKEKCIAVASKADDR